MNLYHISADGKLRYFFCADGAVSLYFNVYDEWMNIFITWIIPENDELSCLEV